MRLWPRTLLWRTFLLLALLILLSMMAWFAIYRAYENEPRAHQLSQLLASVVNLTRSALINAQPEKRSELLRELSTREGIHVYPLDDDEEIAPLPNRDVLARVLTQLKQGLGPDTRMTLERDGERALFVSFKIEDDLYWVALPRERLERNIPWEWLGWGTAALALSLIGAYLVMFRVTRPLNALSAAALEIGHGRMPPLIEEAGPQEVATLARAFNQMSADLKRLDSDRALILAGISHDLRTPLARLLVGIELAGGDEATRAGMVADVEEMDKTIGQFLDFARETGGEAFDDTDVAALLEELSGQYQRRGAHIESEFARLPPLKVQPQALRRAVSNLIDNALRHAGADQPLLLALRSNGRNVEIDVADRGPGIPEEQAERLKLPFTRLDAARGNAIGAGLGLAIVDRIARSHGGHLDLLARSGGGLIARVVLSAGSGQRPMTT